MRLLKQYVATLLIFILIGTSHTMNASKAQPNFWLSSIQTVGSCTLVLTGIGYCFYNSAAKEESLDYIRSIPFPIKCLFAAGGFYFFVNSLINQKNSYKICSLKSKMRRSKYKIKNNKDKLYELRDALVETQATIGLMRAILKDQHLKVIRIDKLMNPGSTQTGWQEALDSVYEEFFNRQNDDDSQQGSYEND
jgi:hypothetical protein